MVARALLLPLLALAIALPTAPVALADSAASAPAASAAAKKKCKKGKVRRHGKCVKKKTKKGPANNGTGNTGTPVTPPPPPPPPPPAAPEAPNGAQLTPDDGAVRQAMANGLFLERSEWGSVTATYYRLFFYPNGVFKGYQVDWNEVSGEICTKSNVGTWSLANGYRFDVQGGGLVAVVNINAGAINGTEILTASNQDSSHVYVGRNMQQWDINPNMLDSCG